MGSIPVRVIKTPLRICARAFFVRPVRESNRAAARSAVSNQPSGLLLSPRVPRVRNVYRGCGCLSANAQGRFLLDPYGNRNNDDRCQRQKQGGVVGAAASRMHGPSKGRCRRWVPQPVTLKKSPPGSFLPPAGGRVPSIPRTGCMKKSLILRSGILFMTRTGIEPMLQP